jgi:hypothetical protein
MRPFGPHAGPRIREDEMRETPTPDAYVRRVPTTVPHFAQR